MPNHLSRETIHVHRVFDADNATPLELTLFYAGREDCAPGHSHYGVRDHFLLHCIFPKPFAPQRDNLRPTTGNMSGEPLPSGIRTETVVFGPPHTLTHPTYRLGARRPTETRPAP